MEKKYNICLDIGGTKVLGAVFNENDEIVYRLKKKTNAGGTSVDNIEQLIISVVDEILTGCGIALSDVAAIGAGAPGVIDSDKGVVLFSPNLPWRNYDLASPIRERFGVPFYVGNDVNVGVLGEYKYGVARGARNVVGFFVGTGMGGGLILNGELFTGTGFKAAELGHMVLDENGPLCGCGQHGCLEAFSAKKGMTRYMQEQIAAGRKTLMNGKIDSNTGVFKSKHLKKALDAGDKVATEAVDRSCHYLAIATGSMINTFSPDMVIYGGGVIEATGDLFVNKILEEVDRYCMPSIRSTVQLKSAALGDDSVLYGALSLIRAGESKD